MTMKQDIEELGRRVEELTRSTVRLNERVYALEQKHEPPHGRPDSIEEVEWEFIDTNGVHYGCALPKGVTPRQARIPNGEHYKVKTAPEEREPELPNGISLDD